MYAARSALAVSAALALLGSAAGAQMRVASVPESATPPAGMCRVWIEGVSVSQQPAPTDCATARARAALLPHARVIYGSNSNRGVNQSTDPRYDPRNRTGYDPRHDSRSAQQRDPRYDPRNDSRYDRHRGQLSRKAEKERAKALRKQQKAWEKAHKRDADDRYDRGR